MVVAIYKTHFNDKDQLVVAIKPHDQAFKTGLPENSIVGYLKEAGAGLHLNNVIINPAFVRFFHTNIQKSAALSTGLASAAQRQIEGFIYVIDLRDKNYPKTEPYDIIGAFAVRKGEIISDTYMPNPLKMIWLILN